MSIFLHGFHRRDGFVPGTIIPFPTFPATVHRHLVGDR
jgi:hypothetical protein